MRITRALLETTSLDEAERYYGSVLGLPVDRTETIVSIRLGDALLEFVEGEPGSPGVHHLAFLVAASSFDSAKRWISARQPLLTLDGADEFRGPGAWNSRSVYFDGPDGSILEFIARLALPDDPKAQGAGSATPFDPGSILGISEVGVATVDVPGVARVLADAAGIPPFGQTSAEFAPTGTDDGLLILVAPGRTWFPTTDRVAAAGRMRVYVTGGRPGTYALSDETSLIVEA